jgi:hypothetical protein
MHLLLSVTHTHSVGPPPWTRERPSQRPLPDNKQHSQETDIHGRDGIRTHSSSKRAVADTCLRPLDHGDRRFCRNYIFKIYRIKSHNKSVIFGFSSKRFSQDFCFSIHRNNPLKIFDPSVLNSHDN